MDESLLLALNGLRSPGLDAVLSPLSSYGYFSFPLLMLFALFRSDRWKEARWIADGWLVWFVAPFLSERILKPLIGRLRPTGDEVLRETLNVMGRVPPETSLSFPSGTATACFAAAIWIQLRWGTKAGVPALLLASTISLSLVYGGVHWPTDILAGAVLGGLIAFGYHKLSTTMDARNNQNA